jgi:acetyltransferase-like isoleucine patch superfamily enzyme
MTSPETATVSPLSVIDDLVTLGSGSTVEEFCVIGRAGVDAGAATEIGLNAHIRSHAVIYNGNRIGRDFQTGHHVLIRQENTIGDDVSIGTGSIVEHHVVIGNRVRIHSAAFIPEYSVLEDDCWIGPRVVLTNAPFPRCPDVLQCMRGVHVGRSARIGANATILPGVRIGESALIGAGAIVARDVPPRTVVAGDPGRVRKTIDELTCPAGLEHRPYV